MRKLSDFELTGMIIVRDIVAEVADLKEIDNKSEGFEIAYEKISHWNISTCRCW